MGMTHITSHPIPQVTSMASSYSQSVERGVSNQNQMERRRMEEVPNGIYGGVVSGLNISMARRPWTRQEDFKLIKHIVFNEGRNRNWKMISAQLPGRTPDSCKVRWWSTLNPLLKKPPLRREKLEVISEQQLRRTDIYVRYFYDALMAMKHASTNPTSVGKTTQNLGIDLNGPSDVYEGRILMGMGGLMTNEETYMASMHDDAHPSSSTNLNPVSLATNNIWQPQSPPSSPKLIDFMGVGSV